MRVVIAGEWRTGSSRLFCGRIRKERSRLLDELVFVGRDHVRDAALASRASIAPPSSSNVTSSPVTVLMISGPGDEHLRDFLGHQDEIGDRRRVDGTAGAGSRDQAQLRDDAAGLDVAPKDFGITAERNDALLNARAAGIVDPDHRRTGAHRQIHYFADLLRERFTERSAEHGEILREDEDLPAVDRRPARDDAVAEKFFFVEPERARAVRDELIEFRKRTVVDQCFDAFASGALSALVLFRDRRFAGGSRSRARVYARALRISPGESSRVGRLHETAPGPCYANRRLRSAFVFVRDGFRNRYLTLLREHSGIVGGDDRVGEIFVVDVFFTVVVLLRSFMA